MTLGILRRSLKISSRHIKEQAYKADVMPTLEYAASLWDPSTEKSIIKLEAVQRRAARFVMNNTSCVTDMMQTLKWPSLQQRRQIARMAMIYKRKLSVHFGRAS